MWLLATSLLALSPLVYFASGGSDAATEASRLGLAAVPAVLAWPLLAVAIGLAHRRQGRATGLILGAAARRASVLMLFAGAVLLLARHLGTTVAIRGDAAWTSFWGASIVLWVVLSFVLVRRPSARQ